MSDREITPYHRIAELEREYAALRAALTGTLDRLEFYVDCLPIARAAYLKTVEGEITNQVISNARAAIDAAKEGKQ